MTTSHQAAGVLVWVRGTDRALFLKKATTGRWETPGGHAEPGETPWHTARRELQEETGEVVLLDDPMPLGDFVLFLAEVDAPFEPKLSEEHTDSAWRSLADPPEPLHSELARLVPL